MPSVKKTPLGSLYLLSTAVQVRVWTYYQSPKSPLINCPRRQWKDIKQLTQPVNWTSLQCIQPSYGEIWKAYLLTMKSRGLVSLACVWPPCVCVCVCACVHACVHAPMLVHAMSSCDGYDGCHSPTCVLHSLAV